MQIDWVTVAAQIVNFLVLVWLLKRFLYGPIVQAMEEREQRVAEKMEEAQQREAEAEEEAQEHREKQEELEERREELLRQAREDANRRRGELIDEAREDVEAIERRWHENLRDERNAFLRELRRRMGSEVCDVARQALGDLANRQLQAQVVEVFMDRLQNLDDERRIQLQEAAGSGERPPTITSAFGLSAGQQKKLSSTVHDVLDRDANVSFENDEALICGVELGVGGVKVAWSIASYLQTLEETVREALERETAEEREEAVEDAMPPTEVKPRNDDRE